MIEIEAKNIETAIKKAENELGVSRKYIKYEIDTDKTQLFSRREKKIVIKAEIDKTSYHPDLSPLLSLFKKETKYNIDFMFKKHSEKVIEVIITGKDSEQFEKKDGELIIAFQYILNKAVGEKKAIVIKVDTENKYKKRKDKKMERLLEKALKEIETNENFITNNLNPSDRKYLHIIASEKGVETESIGSGYYKKVKIFKKNEG
jgi:predicted RNA-binding protein Jag